MPIANTISGVRAPDAMDISPSITSLTGLDAINFFLAGMQAGFGPFVAVLLADARWNQQSIGFVLSANALAGLLSQLPGGELLDASRSKRLLVALAASTVGLSALAIALWPTFPVVFIALILQGMTGGVLGPAIASISLGIVGHAALAERLGRNQRFASAGVLITTGRCRLFCILSGDIPYRRRPCDSVARSPRSYPIGGYSFWALMWSTESPCAYASRES